jgi:zinc protease
LPIAQLSVVFKNGSSRDPMGKSGLVNLSAQMLKEGTAKMTSLELAEAFANLGTEISVNASKDYSSFSTAVLSDKTNAALSLLASMVEKPRFDSNDFARLKLQQKSTVSTDNADPNYLAQIKFLRSAYGDKHPYAYPSGGTLESIPKIELKDIKKTYQSYFGPNNAALIVVGDVSVAEVMESAQKYFGNWPKIKVPSLALNAPFPRKKMQTLLVEVANMPQTYLLVGQPAALRTDKDLASYEVFLNILARDPTSRLNENLREQKGWTYGVKGVVNPLRGLGPLWISTSVQVPYGGEALQEILSELLKLQNTPVSDAELKSAKEGILHSFASRYSTVGKVASQAADLFIYDLPLNNDQVFYDKLANVSKEDIMAVAKKALKKDQMVAVAVGDLEAIETPLKTMDVGIVKVERGKNRAPSKAASDTTKKAGS